MVKIRYNWSCNYIIRSEINLYQQLANATVQIICGSSAGTGFHFLNDEIIVTNHHVIEPHFQNGSSIVARSEDGAQSQLQLLGYSLKGQHDYAILKLTSKFPHPPVILQPKEVSPIQRGADIIFAGFPHGVPHLLVHKAIISAPISNLGFYIDGSVNGGNSGGPIIDASDGKVIAIVTQRRFMGGDEMEGILEESQKLQDHLTNIAGRGSVNIMGVDFGDFSLKMAQTIQVLNSVISQNANSGIGIGFNIRFVVEGCKQLGLIKN